MPQVSQSSANFDNRIDPTFGLRNLENESNQKVIARNKQATAIGALRRTLALKGITSLKGKVSIGEDGIPQFDNTEDRESIYNIRSNDRSKSGTGTTINSTLRPSDAANARARAESVIGASDEIARGVISGENPVIKTVLGKDGKTEVKTPDGKTEVKVPDDTPPPLRTPKQMEQEAFNRDQAEAIKSGKAEDWRTGGDPAKIAAAKAAITSAVSPKSTSASKSASSSENWNTSITGADYNETGTNLQDVYTNRDIAVADGVKMDLRDMMAADVMDSASNNLSGATGSTAMSKAIEAYHATTAALNAAYDKQGTSHEIKDAGNWGIKRQGISGSHQEGVSSSTSVSTGDRYGGTTAKEDDKYRKLVGADGTDFKIKFIPKTGKYRVPGNTGYDLNSPEAKINVNNMEELANKYKSFWAKQFPKSGFTTSIDPATNGLNLLKNGKIIGRAVLDDKNAYIMDKTGAISQRQINTGKPGESSYSKIHVSLVNPNDETSNDEFETDAATIQATTFQLPSD